MVVAFGAAFVLFVGPDFLGVAVDVFLGFRFLSSKSEPSDADVYFTALVAWLDLRVDISAFGVVLLFGYAELERK